MALNHSKIRVALAVGSIANFRCHVSAVMSFAVLAVGRGREWRHLTPITPKRTDPNPVPSTHLGAIGSTGWPHF
jgi:hypothetical protein